MSTMPSAAAPRRSRCAAAVAATLVAITAAQAQTVEDGLWHGGISLGGAFSSGNTSSQTLSLTADATKARPIDRIGLSALLNYGRTERDGVKTTTADQAWLRGRYDYNLSAAMFVFGGASAETYKAAGTDSRWDLSTGLGYRFIRTPTTTFEVFAGVGYASVDFTDGSSADGAQLVLGEESSHKLSESTTARQRLVYRPGRGELGDIATFNATLATAITGAWTLNVGFASQWASEVPAGTKSTDSLLTVGFGYKF